MTECTFRPYRNEDNKACIRIFDANCPAFFAANERDEYQDFLASAPQAYQVCDVDGQVLGAFGLFRDSQKSMVLNWILLDPQTQGLGIGSKIMERVLQLGRGSEATTVNIAASHKSAPFFAKFGAKPAATIQHGWGPGMHRIDMVLSL